MKEKKNELILLSDVLKNEDKYKALYVKIPKAILIYGEPGLGKTLMAESMIKEVGREFFLAKKDRADGEFVSAIKKTFEDAIKAQPSIVLLDDMDKYAQNNLEEDSNKEEFVIIRSCLEDIKDKSVFVIATANDIDHIPKSLLRAGRFGRQLQVRAPKHDDAVKIIRHFLSLKKNK